MPIVPLNYFEPTPSTEGISYTAPSTTAKNAFVKVELPMPYSAADMEDLESFEVLLRQYKSLGAEASALTNVTAPTLGSAGAPPLADELRGKLMLVNQDNGEVVGELDQELDVEDEQRLARDPKGKPVMLNFGNVIDGYAPKVKVQTVPQEELDDWMLKGAHNVRWVTRGDKQLI